MPPRTKGIAHWSLFSSARTRRFWPTHDGNAKPGRDELEPSTSAVTIREIQEELSGGAGLTCAS